METTTMQPRRRGPGRPRKGEERNKLTTTAYVQDELKRRFRVEEDSFYAVASIQFSNVVYCGQSEVRAADLLDPGMCFAVGKTAVEAHHLVVVEVNRFRDLHLGPMPPPKRPLPKRNPLETLLGPEDP
jgi:hypothetical protein